MNKPKVRFSFRYSELDYIRAVRAYNLARLRIWLDLVVIVFVGVATVYLWQFPSLHWFSITLMSVLGILGLGLLISFTVIPPIVFRRDRKFRDKYTVTCSGDGIRFESTHVDSLIQWSAYSQALIDSYSYVLKYGKSFTAIPKRVFHNESQKKQFEQLLTVHISEILRKT
jgi:hypothetical protein